MFLHKNISIILGSRFGGVGRRRWSNQLRRGSCAKGIGIRRYRSRGYLDNNNLRLGGHKSKKHPQAPEAKHNHNRHHKCADDCPFSFSHWEAPLLSKRSQMKSPALLDAVQAMGVYELPPTRLRTRCQRISNEPWHLRSRQGKCKRMTCPQHAVFVYSLPTR